MFYYRVFSVENEYFYKDILTSDDQDNNKFLIVFVLDHIGHSDQVDE